LRERGVRAWWHLCSSISSFTHCGFVHHVQMSTLKKENKVLVVWWK
jgi:hypothetical protein